MSCLLVNNTICVNTHGSFECKCSQGLKNVSNTCVDIDECSIDINQSICTNGSQCRNTFGSYECICSAGSKWSSLTLKCEDLNECDDDYDNEMTQCIDDHSTCVNTLGSFYCECEKGWNRTDLIYCSGIK
jgi:hypothetical protein